MAKGDIILLTGGSGFVGFRTLIVALKAGYRVRAAVRSDASVQRIRGNAEVKKLSLPSDDYLTFTIVPDIVAKGAFKDAIKGVQYVIHVASPIPQQNVDGHKDADRVFIKPTRDGVLEMLAAAKSEPGVRKVVVTSSAVGFIPGKVWGGLELSDKKFEGSDRTQTPEGPFQNAAQAYAASKVAALNATDEWVSREQPAFDVVNVHPSWVIGPASLVNSREEFRNGTNRYPIGVATGRVKELIGDRKLAGASVHVDDVALVQVLAIEKDVKGYKSLVASSPMRWQDITGMVQQYTPEALTEGVFRTDAEQPTVSINLDGSETERILGFKFRSFGDQIKDVLQQYASLPESA